MTSSEELEVEGSLKPFVLRVDVVRTALTRLRHQSIHPLIVAYLEVRRAAMAAHDLETLHPTWSEVGHFLRIPGGPPNRPFYRPFSIEPDTDPSRYWLNPNLAGSFAPSSLRNRARFMLDDARQNYRLSPDHVDAALDALLNRQRLPLWAMACFYLRDVAFYSESHPEIDDLYAAFEEILEFTGDNALAMDAEGDLALLFDEGPPAIVGSWFEPIAGREDRDAEGGGK